MVDKIRSPLLLTAVMMTSALSCHDMGTDAAFYHLAGVQVQAADSSMYVTNNTAETIRYFAVERGTAALINWAATCGSSNAVATGNKKEVPYSKVFGYYRGSQIILYWWHCTEDAMGKLRPNSIRTMVVGTPQ